MSSDARYAKRQNNRTPDKGFKKQHNRIWKNNFKRQLVKFFRNPEFEIIDQSRNSSAKWEWN